MPPRVVLFLLVVTATAQDVLGPVEQAMERREWSAALTALERLESDLPDTERRRAIELRARCHVGLGDHAAAEKALRAVLSTTSEDDPRRGLLIGRLAASLDRQGLFDEAIRTVDEALDVAPDDSLRRLAIAARLRARRFGEIEPIARALLRSRPDDDWGRFALGVSLARQGRYDAATELLRHGLTDPETRRDARFELGLALAALGEQRASLEQFVAILEQDPFDAEACHQLIRRLISQRTRPTSRLAARLTRYFDRLREAEGRASTDVHLEDAGELAASALLRSERALRLGDYESVRRQLDLARAMAPRSPAVALRRAAFFTRSALLTVAESELAPLVADSGSPAALAAALERARESIRRERERIATLPAGPLRVGLESVARSAVEDAATALLALLAAAREADDAATADRAARTLLAFEPDSPEALAHLAERTAEPDLVVPHLHYLARLAKARPNDPRVADGLARVRETLLAPADPR